jgi:uncharacterized protein
MPHSSNRFFHSSGGCSAQAPTSRPSVIRLRRITVTRPAANVVRVTLDDLAQVGKVIDTATGSGANRIQSLQFTLKNRQTVEAQALTEAARNARRKADTLAAALGVNVLRIISVSESSPVVVPVREVAYARAETVTTPIEAGTIEVRATVSLVVEISPR